MHTISFRASLATLAMLTILAACTADPSLTPSGSPSAGADATADPAASASPSAEASAAALPELTWERLEVPALGENSVISDVAAFGPGYIALVTGVMESGILSSADGREWTAVPQPEWVNVGLASMVEADGRLVAVGRDMADVDTNLAVAWLSDDGLEWRRAEAGPDLEDAQLIEVIATDDGLVAIGGYPAVDAAGVWTSPDGEVWTASPPNDTFAQAFLWSVAQADSGLVAVGWRRNPDPEIGFDPAFWTSADGVEWILAPTPEGAPGAQVRDVAAAGDVIVAVGDLVNGGRGLAWRSIEGSSWEVVESGSFDGAVLAKVNAFGGGFVAVGGRGIADAGLWFSVDGSEWTIADDPVFAESYLAETLGVGDDLIAVGATQTQIEGTGSYETAPLIVYGSAVD